MSDRYGYDRFPEHPLHIQPRLIIPEEPAAEVLAAVRGLLASKPKWATAGPLRIQPKLRLDYGVAASAEQIAGALREMVVVR